MKIAFRQLLAMAAIILAGYLPAAAHETAIAAFLNRIGGEGAADKMVTVLDTNAAENGRETFVISSEGGKPKITGSSLSAITTGIGWYLNHHANINLAWNRLTTTFPASLPAPTGTETHECRADYRYYLNYCTFSYSMSTYTWDRWQKEIDWMALHGINMPLQIIGLDVTWYNLLTMDYGYSPAEANAFIAGPCFQAWWGMNNLEGWGGPNPEWWYERQAKLAKQVIDRERELGIEPVLPGFAGMVPTNFQSKTGISTAAQGVWCGYTRPHLVSATDSRYTEVAQNYYKRLHEVMGGESKYYSMDPFHEGGAPSDGKFEEGYRAVYEEMNKVNAESQWVVQQWQFSGNQRKLFSTGTVPIGRLIVLDLYSDGNPNLGIYNGHDVLWCALPNFGARTGFFGRFNNMISGYFKAIKEHGNIKGIGATPEGIEQTPVVYDILFELPWRDSQPDPAAWMADYTTARYGEDNEQAKAAWENLRMSALNNTTSLQGPHEAIICSRPSLTVNKVSSWGGADIFYDTQKMYQAAYQLLNSGLPASNENYSYDLTDIARQALTDYSKSLLAAIKEANDAGNTALFNARKEAFLQLILDIDELLNTNPTFMLGHWTELARQIADEIPGTTTADRDWLEKNNARTIISTWGDRGQAEGGGLRDYSYREWGGMLKDYYYQRWKIWFDNGMKAPSEGWFNWEWNWAHNDNTRYPMTAIGETPTVAAKHLKKYLIPFASSSEDANVDNIYVQKNVDNNFTGRLSDVIILGQAYSPSISEDCGLTISSYEIDANDNDKFDSNEKIEGTTIANTENISVGDHKIRVTLSDGTTLTYNISVKAIVSSPRTLTIIVPEDMDNSCSVGLSTIDGTKVEGNTYTGTDYVTFTATPGNSYAFGGWFDEGNNLVSSREVFNYYGTESLTLRPRFDINIWGVPQSVRTDKDVSDMRANNQFLTEFSVTQNDGDYSEVLLTADELPESHFFYIPTAIKAAPGGEFDFHWKGDVNGLKYLFLSSYVDLNADGTFELTPGEEFVGSIGTHKAQDNNVAAGNFKVLLPFTTPQGVTHIRMRFDSAWLDDKVKDSWNAEIGAFLPTVATNRLIYEVLLQVNSAPEYDMTVTASTNDISLGTVDINQELFSPGETAILRAYPAIGCTLVGWRDQHGRFLPREWMDGNTLTFTAYDNAQITAVFEPPMELEGGWILDVEAIDNDNRAVVGVVQEGDNTLDLSSNSIDKTIVSIDENVFSGMDIEKVILPDNEIKVSGVTSAPTRTIKANITGTGGSSNTFPADLSALTGQNFVMSIHVEAGQLSEPGNPWGSTLFATGTNPTANGYDGGLQIYYGNGPDQSANPNKIIIKCTGKEIVTHAINPANAFDITVSSTDGEVKIVIESPEGKTEVSRTMDINFSNGGSYLMHANTGYSLNVGYDFATPTFGELFKGHRELMEYAVNEGNSTYTVENGTLYDNEGKCIAFPEGRLFSHTFRLSTAAGEYMYSNSTHSSKTTDSNGLPALNGDDAARNVLASSDKSDAHNAIWRLIDIDGRKVKINQVNANTNLGSASPVQTVNRREQWHGEYGYTLVYGLDKVAIDFTIGSKHAIISSSNKKLIHDENVTNPLYIEEVTSLKTDLGTEGLAAVAFPLSVIVPESESFSVNVLSATRDASKGGKAYLYPLKAGTLLAPGEGIIIKSLQSRAAQTSPEFEVNYTKDVDPEELYVENLLSATTAPVTDLPTVEGMSYYVVTPSGLEPATSENLDGNTPYLLMEDVKDSQSDMSVTIPFTEPNTYPTKIEVIPTQVAVEYEFDKPSGEPQTYTFIAQVSPEDAMQQEVTWTIEGDDVGSFENPESGVLTLSGTGTATVKATLEYNSDIFATSTIVVTKKDVPCTAFTLEEKGLTLFVGAEKQLNVTIAPVNTTIDKTITWVSSDDNIATVSSQGKVTAIAGGEATITGTLVGDASKIVTTSVRVISYVGIESFGFVASELNLLVGGQPVATEVTVNNDITLEYTIEYSSSADAVATIDEQGVVTPVGPGSATITAKATDTKGGSATATLTVVVDYPQISIGVSPSSMTLAAGFSKNLRATILSGYQVALTYESSDESVVTVSNVGKVTAIAPGTAVITVTATDAGGNTVESQVNVVVTEATTSGEAAVAITPATTTLAEGATTLLAYTLTGCTEADVASVSWTTTDGSVITIDADGTLHGVGIGTASVTLTVTLTDGSIIRAYCSVAVTATTGIDNINADAANGSAVIFDLAGRRLQRVIAPGVYIVNGVKTMVR